MAVTFGLHPWDMKRLDSLEQLWFIRASIWHENQRRERDQKMIEAIGRIMGAKR